MSNIREHFESFKRYLHREEERILHGKIIAMLRPFVREDMRLLEVGCSDGTYAVDRCKKLGLRKVFGVDVGTKRLEQARVRRVTAFECDIEEDKLPFGDEFFDIIICNQVMEHLKKIHFLMDECYRVLKNEGLFLVSVPNMASLHNRLLLLAGKQPTCLQVMSEHVRGFTPDAFMWYLTFNSFYELISYKGTGFYPIPPPISIVLSEFFTKLAVFQIVLLRKTKDKGHISWVEEFKRRHIAGYGEDFWFKQ